MPAPAMSLNLLELLAAGPVDNNGRPSGRRLKSSPGAMPYALLGQGVSRQQAEREAVVSTAVWVCSLRDLVCSATSTGTQDVVVLRVWPNVDS